MNDEKMILLECSHVAKSYALGKSSVPVLQDVNLQLFKGSWNAILGASGSGKTTLLNLLGTLETPSSGEIIFNGRKYSDMSRRESSFFRAEKIGFVFQSYQLLPELNILENVMLHGMLNGMSKKIANEKAVQLLSEVGLADRLKHRPSEMSGGEQQRAAIARALLNSPELLLADEPTGNLDRKNGEAILELFKELHHKEKCTIVMITHSNTVASLAENIFTLENGVIVNNSETAL